MSAQIVLNGLVSGLTLSLLALAFSLVYLPTRVFHVAMAGIYVVVPYVALSFNGRIDSHFGALVTAVLVGILVSILTEILNHRWLEKRRASPGAHLIASLGMYIIIVHAVALTWGSRPQVLRSGVDPVIDLTSAGLVLTNTQFISSLIAVALLSLVYSWLYMTNLGIRFRAMADNPSEFALLGYHIGAHRVLAFGLSGLLVGTASLSVAYDSTFEPYAGLQMFVLAVVSVVIGGRSSFVGPVIAALSLGIVRSVIEWAFSNKWQDAFTFILLLLLLYLRPGGLIGRHSPREATA